MLTFLIALASISVGGLYEAIVCYIGEKEFLKEEGEDDYEIDEIEPKGN